MAFSTVCIYLLGHSWFLYTQKNEWNSIQCSTSLALREQWVLRVQLSKLSRFLDSRLKGRCRFIASFPGLLHLLRCPSVLAYCKRSKTRDVEGLGTRLHNKEELQFDIIIICMIVHIKLQWGTAFIYLFTLVYLCQSDLVGQAMHARSKWLTASHQDDEQQR